MLSSLIGGEDVPSSLCVFEPSPPFVVIIPLVLDGGRTWSSVFVSESPGDWDRERLRDSVVLSVMGIGEEEDTGAADNDPVTDEGECVLRRVLDPGFAKPGGVSGGMPGTADPSKPAPRLDNGEVDVDNGCCRIADDCSSDFRHWAIISSFIIPRAASIPVPGVGSIPEGGTGNKGCLTPDPGNPGKLEDPTNKR